jgi:hypothetical protein
MSEYGEAMIYPPDPPDPAEWPDPYGGSVATLSPLSLDIFALMTADDDGCLDFATLTPSRIARSAARMPVGLGMAPVLSLLELDADDAVSLSHLDEAGLLHAVGALTRFEGYLAGLRTRALSVLSVLPAGPIPAGAKAVRTPEHWDGVVRSHRSDMVATLTGTSPFVGALAMKRAEQLAPGGRLQGTGAEVEQGRLLASKAALIADELAGADDDVAILIEAAILPLAAAMGYGRLRTAIRAEIAAAAPDDMADDHAEAARARRVEPPVNEGQGIASLRICGPAPEIHALWTALDSLGARRKSDGAAHCRARRSTETSRAANGPADEPIDPADSDLVGIDAHRFDALAALAFAALADPSLPKDHGRRPAISVSVALSTLLGLDNAPGELEGHGQIDAESARLLAADPTGTWRRIITDDTGRLLELGTAKYRPPAGLAAHVLARDRTCRAPGCRRRRMDLDHIQEYAAGGATSDANLGGLCRRHHVIKTLGLIDYTRDCANGQVH